MEQSKEPTILKPILTPSVNLEEIFMKSKNIFGWKEH